MTECYLLVSVSAYYVVIGSVLLLNSRCLLNLSTNLFLAIYFIVYLRHSSEFFRFWRIIVGDVIHIRVRMKENNY